MVDDYFDDLLLKETPKATFSGWTFAHSISISESEKSAQ